MGYYNDPYLANFHYVKLFKFPTDVSLRKRLVTFHQNSAGLLAAYEELKLNPTEQMIISSFLEGCHKHRRLSWEQILTKKKVAGSLDDCFQFIKSLRITSERSYLILLPWQRDLCQCLGLCSSQKKVMKIAMVVMKEKNIDFVNFVYNQEYIYKFRPGPYILSEVLLK